MSILRYVLEKKKQYSKTRKVREMRDFLPTKRWKIKKLKRVYRAKYRRLPYILQIKIFRSNIFLHLRDLRGKLIYSLSSGFNFVGTSKKTFVAIRVLTDDFLSVLYQLEYKNLFIEFYNHRSKKLAFIKGLKNVRKKFKYVGCIYRFNLQFNGCRHKKKRR